MIHDLHSHTNYSFCGKDDFPELCEGVIQSGIEVFGISDHNNGITRSENYEALREYFDRLTAVRDEYAGRLRILRGL